MRKINSVLIFTNKGLGNFTFFFFTLGRAIVFPKANEKRFTEEGRIGD